MSETNLRAALDQHLSQMASAPPIAWENAPFTQDGQTYLVQNIMPAQTQTIGMEQGGSDLLAGVYQVAVYAPKGRGKGAALTEVERITSRFTRGLTVTFGDTVVSLQKVWTSPSISTETHYIIPVSIRYRAIT